MQFVQIIMVAQSALPALFFGADALSETGLASLQAVYHHSRQSPFEITNLTRLKITHLDTPTALAQLLQNETANAAFYHLPLIIITPAQTDLYRRPGLTFAQELVGCFTSRYTSLE